jgi:hypothetical protein
MGKNHCILLISFFRFFRFFRFRPSSETEFTLVRRPIVGAWFNP